MEPQIPQLVLVFPRKVSVFPGRLSRKQEEEEEDKDKKKKRDARAHRAASIYKTCVVSFRARVLNKRKLLYSSILQTTLYT